MFPAYLLSLREGLEAALIIGIVLGALRKIRRSELSSVVWGGVISASLVSLVVALSLNSVGASLEGAAEQIFEGTTMFLAAFVLTWMIFWMSRQARTLKSDLESSVRHAALQRSQKAMFLLAFTAVTREGVELALFLTASVVASDARQTLIGALLGLGTAVLTGWMVFATTARLNLRRFFQVTGGLLILFAAGLVAYGVHEFNEVGWIPAIVEPMWDLNFLLNEGSLVGQILKALFGYNGNPSLTEVIAYLGYFAVIGLGLWYSNRQVVTLPEAAR